MTYFLKPLRSGQVLLFALIFFLPILAIAETVSNIDIVPDLDISIFSPYVIKADISGSPSTVSAVISGVNGDGGNYWNYYADGTPVSDSRTKTLTYNADEDKYISGSIYPDDIYPEIFFAPSSITWAYAPSNIDLRRNSYHLLHFNNPFTIRATTTFLLNLMRSLARQ